MQVALVDSNVLISAVNVDSLDHEPAVELVKAADEGTVPRLRILDYVVAETFDFVAERIGRSAGADLYDRLSRSPGFEFVQSTQKDDRRAMKSMRASSALSFVDAALGVYARRAEVEYCYSFDDDLDELDAVSRLNRPIDPYSPE